MKKIKEKRPTLIAENKTLLQTIRSLQDESGNLKIANHELDKDNAVLNEKLSNLGLRTLAKEFGILGLGASIGLIVNRQFFEASILGVVSGLIMTAFSIYDSFRRTKQKDKEKV